MKVNFYYDNNAVHRYVIDALFEGCPFTARGLPLTGYRPSDVAVMFGMYKRSVRGTGPRKTIIEGQREIGGTTVVVDSGYVRRGDEADSYYSVGLNGLNGRADFRNFQMPDDRWKALGIDLKPWRKDGRHILLMGQVPWDAAVQNVYFMEWAQATALRLREITDRPIVYRAHPKAFTRAPEGTGQSENASLEDDLKDCWAVVTYNSNSAVDALIQGYPVYAHDVGSMVWGVAESSLKGILQPDLHDWRVGWAANLAYTQWTPDEMKKGLTWKHLFR